MKSSDRAERYSHEDPGLQPERTTLARVRTSLALTVVGVLLLRVALVEGRSAVLLAGATGATALGMLLGAAGTRMHGRAVAAFRRGTTAVPFRWMLAVTAGTVGVPVGALIAR